MTQRRHKGAEHKAGESKPNQPRISTVGRFHQMNLSVYLWWCCGAGSAESGETRSHGLTTLAFTYILSIKIYSYFAVHL